MKGELLSRLGGGGSISTFTVSCALEKIISADFFSPLLSHWKVGRLAYRSSLAISMLLLLTGKAKLCENYHF